MQYNPCIILHAWSGGLFKRFCSYNGTHITRYFIVKAQKIGSSQRNFEMNQITCKTLLSLASISQQWSDFQQILQFTDNFYTVYTYDNAQSWK